MASFTALQELRRHLKREFAKLLTLLQAYAVIATGVRIICTNQVQPPVILSYLQPLIYMLLYECAVGPDEHAHPPASSP